MARYDSLRKIDRNEEIRKYRRKNKDLSLREIGQAFGISAQRVWVILNNKPTDSKEVPGSDH